MNSVILLKQSGEPQAIVTTTNINLCVFGIINIIKWSLAAKLILELIFIKLTC